MLNLYKKIFFSHFVSYIWWPEWGAPAESVRPVSREDAQRLQEMRAQIEDLWSDGLDNSDVLAVLAWMDEDRESLSEFTRQWQANLIRDMLKDMGTQIAQDGTDINLVTTYWYRWDPDIHRVSVDRNDGMIWDTKFDALWNAALNGLLEKANISTEEALALVSQWNNQIIAGQALRWTDAGEVEAYQTQLAAADLAKRLSDEDAMMNADLWIVPWENYKAMMANFDRADRLEDEDTAMSWTLDIGNEVDYDGNKENLLMSQWFDTGAATRDIASTAVENERNAAMEELIVNAKDFFDGADEFPELPWNDIARAEELSIALGYTPEELIAVGLTIDDATNAYNAAINSRLAEIGVEAEETLMAQTIDTDTAQRDIDANAEETVMTQSLESNLDSETYPLLLSALQDWDGQVGFSEIQGNEEASTAIQQALINHFGIERIQTILGRSDMTEEKFSDGVYGWWTSKVVWEYQTAMGLLVDWEAGTQTIASLTGLDYDSATRMASLPTQVDTWVMMAQNTRAARDEEAV